MRLSDLLHARVLGPGDEELGKVLDIRMVQDGPVLGTWGAAFRVQGLILSKRTIGGFFGYERSDLNAPWLVNAIVNRLHKDAAYVEWAHVTSCERGLVRIDVGRSGLSPIPRLER
jgi:hypothetical protein